MAVNVQNLSMAEEGRHCLLLLIVISDGDPAARYNENCEILLKCSGDEARRFGGSDPIHVGRGYCSQETPQGHGGGGGLDWFSNTGNDQVTAVNTYCGMGFSRLYAAIHLLPVPIKLSST